MAVEQELSHKNRLIIAKRVLLHKLALISPPVFPFLGRFQDYKVATAKLKYLETTTISHYDFIYICKLSQLTLELFSLSNEVDVGIDSRVWPQVIGFNLGDRRAEETKASPESIESNSLFSMIKTDVMRF